MDAQEDDITLLELLLQAENSDMEHMDVQQAVRTFPIHFHSVPTDAACNGSEAQIQLSVIAGWTFTGALTAVWGEESW